MPVEIRELIIRAVTTAKADETDDLLLNQEFPAGVQTDDSDDSPLNQDSLDDKDAIVQECVKQVLRILQKKRER